MVLSCPRLQAVGDLGTSSWHLSWTLYKTYRIPEKLIPAQAGIQWRLVSDQRAVSGLRRKPERRRKLLWLLPRTHPRAIFGYAVPQGVFAYHCQKAIYKKSSGHVLASFRFPCSTQYECTKSSY